MAAGLGFKDFVTGEVLTAADVDGYLMQGVWVFASAAARDAAVTSPQEGNFAYLKDTNVTTYYTGSAWANLDTTGMTNPMTTTGDTIYSSPGSTPVRLGIGSTGNVLTVAGGVPTWAAPAGSGGMTLIQSISGSGTAEIVFSSIPSTYKNLQLVARNFQHTSGATQALSIRLNTDTNTRYLNVPKSSSELYSDTPISFSQTSWDWGFRIASGSNNNFLIANIYDYANTTTWKTAQTYAQMQNSSNTVYLRQDSVYNQTGAISSITLFSPQGANIDSGTFLLYGVS
jgi:hypothetical protein